MESIISSCFESKSTELADHLFRDCNLIKKMLETDKEPVLSGGDDKVDTCFNCKILPCQLSDQGLRVLNYFTSDATSL